MPRIRSVKHQFFLSLKVASVPRDARLLFIGLLTLADREGRLENQPQRIRVQLFPYDDDINRDSVEKLLGSLEESSLIQRYEAKGEEYIQIKGFAKHQHCHVNEAKSVIPPPHDTGTVQARYKHQSSTRAASDEHACISDSGISDSGEMGDGGLGEGASAPASAAKASSASGGAKPKAAGAKAKRKPPLLVDDAFLDELQADPAYAVLDVRLVAAKMFRWCKQREKEPTRNRLIGWLNKEDRPLGNVKSVDTAKRDVGKHRTAESEPVEEEEVHWSTEEYIAWANKHEKEQEQSDLRAPEPK